MRRSRKVRQEITKEQWNEAVLPGTNLELSVLIKSPTIESLLRCPRCNKFLSNSSIRKARFWCVSSLQSFTSFLTTDSTHCDQNYHLAMADKDSMSSGSSTTMMTETVDVTDEETAEIRLYKHMHLLPKQNLHQYIPHQPIPCGHCREGPMTEKLNYHCIFCGHQKDVYSYLGIVNLSTRGR